MDDHVAAFLRQRDGGLAFQIEMLLPADFHRARDHMLRGLDRLGRIALLIDPRPILEPAVRGQRLIHRQDRRQFLVLDLRQPGGLSRLQMRLGSDQKDRLADIVHHAVRQHRFRRRRGRDIVLMRQVAGGQHRDDPRRIPHRVEVQRNDPPMGHLRQSKGQVQRIHGQRDVIDIARLSRHMQGRGIMGKRLGDSHARTSRTLTVSPARSR